MISTARRVFRMASALAVLLPLALGATPASARNVTEVSTPAAAPAAVPTAVTSFSFTSAPGDFIGQGQTRTFTAPSSTFSVSGTASNLTFRASSSTDNFSVVLGAPSGQALQPGRYADAERSEFRTGRSPGIDITGDSRGCNEDFGSFAVNQIGTDASGNVNLLDVNFTQRCESATAPALTGSVRFQAFPLSYRMQSDAGDFIGGGVSKTYLNSTSLLSVSGTLNGVQVSVSGLRDEWTMEIDPPTGQQLAVGSFPNAQRFPGAGVPGLDVFGDGRGCNTVTGSFDIKAIATDPSGNVTALSATFVQHCEGATPADNGTIHLFA